MAAKFDKDDNTGLPVAPERELTENEITEVQPEDCDYKGAYQYKKDGLVYALAVKEDSIRGKTHHLKNTGFFWEGTKEDFEKNFVKV